MIKLNSKILFISLILILMISLNVAAQENNLYLKDSLNLLLKVDGKFSLLAQSGGAEVKEVKTEVLLYPGNDFRQKLNSLDTTGTVQKSSIIYNWNDGTLGEKNFGYTAEVQTGNQRLKVDKKFNFPLSPSAVAGYEEYLQPTETIDSGNRAVIAKASELAEGEDDLFKVVFNLANWVDENVKYDLNSLTEKASQKASWVLENKQGVCDEMTSLFVAMARSLGIPARFVSGISYTTSKLFSENWQPHGWAEVYFPDIGWVSFDIAFGEYGYVDVTHIKLMDGFDPAEPATKYEWLANNVQLQAGELGMTISIQKTGAEIPEDIELAQQIMADEVGFGSYNLIKGIVRNDKNYYSAATLKIAIPKELEIIGKNRRTIMLSPKEVRETYWIVKIPENLDQNYFYEFPIYLYSEKNVSIEDRFKVLMGSPIYSQEEIQKLSVQDEEKSYSRKVSFECQYQDKIKPGENIKISCEIKNVGNSNLQKINFCLETSCKIIDLPINQKENIAYSAPAGEVGWHKLVLSADNDQIEKKTSLPYLVLDEPKISLDAELPLTINYGESFLIKIRLNKDSFSDPKKVTVKLDAPGFGNSWEIDDLQKSEELPLNIVNYLKLGSSNKFRIHAEWQDEEGKKYSSEKIFTVKGQAGSFWNRIKMFFNGIIY